MKKSEILEALTEATGETKATVERVYSATFDLIKSELSKGNKVSISGFGTFQVSDVKEREARNPRTGEVLKVAAHKSPKFKAGKELKDVVNK